MSTNNSELVGPLSSSPQTGVETTPVITTDAPGALSDASRAARMGLLALGVGFGGFLLWASLAPLDEGVPAHGMVTIDTKRKPVQHLQGGIVKEVLVREGEIVKAGQVLLRLDNSVASASFETIRQRYLSLRATQGRLLAEQSGKSTMVFHPDLVAASKDPLIQQQLHTQQQLLASRRMALEAALQTAQASIRGQEGMLTAYSGMQVNRRQQHALLVQELESTRGLVAEGYAPRNRQMELERMVAESASSQLELQGNQVRAQSAVSELRQRLVSIEKEYRKEIESQLADVTRDVLAEESKFKAVSEDLVRSDITSPVAGQVMTLAVQSPGSVVQPGQKLMDVVPEDESLLLEVRVEPHLIDKVKTDLVVDVRFAGFAHTPRLVVEGKVVSITNDLVSDPQQPGVNYYVARVSVTSEGLKALGKHQMQPGMPVEVVFKTGERSLLAYLLHPLTKRIASAMKEE